MRLNKTSIFSLLIFATTLISCGGGVSGENGSDPFGSNDSEVTTTLKLGYFNSQNQFIEGEIGVSSSANGISEVSASGSIGLSVVVVNEDNVRVQTATNVSFVSACVIAAKATLNSEVSTVNGQADNTFLDQGCGGASGISDEITASIVNNGNTIAASAKIDIQPDAIGALRFVSATPQSILLSGSGDISKTQSSITFVVVNEQGIALADQVVSFALSSEIGGVALSDTQIKSNTNGEVSVKLNAGNVPTTVRVNAQVESASGDTIVTQSESVSVTTGLPNQYSFSLAKDLNNVEGADRDGEQVNFEARLSDTFGNPVPDNTLINFTAEGGQIESNCATIDGACNVVWTSANPRTDDGIVTILATAIGHETLFDSNGNNVYDQEDGVAIDDDSDSGIFIAHPTGTTGFIDMSEAWRDDNDDGSWNAGEIFLDYNNNQTFDQADGLFNGLQCTDSSLCGTGDTASIHVRKSAKLIVSGSSALIDVVIENNVRLSSNYQNPFDALQAVLAREQKTEFSVLIKDSNGNIMPANTNVEVTTTAGELEILSGTIVQNEFSKTPSELVFTLENNLAADVISDIANIKIVINTPSGHQTILEFKAELQ